MDPVAEESAIATDLSGSFACGVCARYVIGSARDRCNACYELCTRIYRSRSVTVAAVPHGGIALPDGNRACRRWGLSSRPASLARPGMRHGDTDFLAGCGFR